MVVLVDLLNRLWFAYLGQLGLRCHLGHGLSFVHDDLGNLQQACVVQFVFNICGRLHLLHRYFLVDALSRFVKQVVDLTHITLGDVRDFAR